MKPTAELQPSNTHTFSAKENTDLLVKNTNLYICFYYSWLHAAVPHVQSGMKYVHMKCEIPFHYSGAILQSLMQGYLGSYRFAYLLYLSKLEKALRFERLKKIK